MFNITGRDSGGGKMELHQVDLNLLVLFNQLMVERRVSKVADALGLTQPAVSNSLAKMRRLFGDELFLRTPSGMVPTPFAEQLAEPVGYALAMVSISRPISTPRRLNAR
jgi:DNA-binding transcriptional LysR family regulator